MSQQERESRKKEFELLMDELHRMYPLSNVIRSIGGKNHGNTMLRIFEFCEIKRIRQALEKLANK